MARYFLRIRDGDDLLPEDDEGEEFATLAAVHRAAIESAREILSQAALSGKAGTLNQKIEVMNEAGKLVLTVPVGHASGTESQA